MVVTLNACDWALAGSAPITGTSSSPNKPATSTLTSLVVPHPEFGRRKNRMALFPFYLLRLHTVASHFIVTSRPSREQGGNHPKDSVQPMRLGDVEMDVQVLSTVALRGRRRSRCPTGRRQSEDGHIGGHSNLYGRHDQGIAIVVAERIIGYVGHDGDGASPVREGC